MSSVVDLEFALVEFIFKIAVANPEEFAVNEISPLFFNVFTII